MSRMFNTWFVALLGLVFSTGLYAQIQSETVAYRDGEVDLEGYMVWDDRFEGKRPGIIVVHEWWGLNDYARKRARMLAELGYVAFAVDMYGKGKVTEHGARAKEWYLQIANNIEAWRRRALLGLDLLRKHKLVDPEHTAAIGYCFGGATVMEMAYAGADLDAVVSFHGSLPLPEEGGAPIRARILAAHGYADAFIPPGQVDKFQQALEATGADWEMAIYAGARHGFTNADAGRYEMENVEYNPKADARSWQSMRRFLKEAFAAE